MQNINIYTTYLHLTLIVKEVMKQEMSYTHIGINIGTMSFNRLSILVNDKLCEVPLDKTAKIKQDSRANGALSKHRKYPRVLFLL
jgi:hypothetical protein